MDGLPVTLRGLDERGDLVANSVLNPDTAVRIHPTLKQCKGITEARAAAVNADPGAFETRHRSRYPGEISDRNEPGTERFQDGADGLSEAEGAPRTGTVAKELPGTGGAIPRLCHEEELPVPGGNAQAVGVVIKKDRHRGELSPSVRSS